MLPVPRERIGVTKETADMEASQTRGYCVAKNPSARCACSGQAATHRAARPGPSRRKERLLGRTRSFFTNCLHESDKRGERVGHDQDDQTGSLIINFSYADLHALRHREGMGKLAFPPQGVGTPVCSLERRLSADGRLRHTALRAAGSRGRLSPHGSSWLLHYFLRSKSAATKAAKTTEMIPFIVKKAAFNLERSPGFTRECS
jgi:hypothetical protein